MTGRALARIGLLTAAGYAVFWLGAFILLVGTPALLPSYFGLSWTGGGPTVTYVQLTGLFGALCGGIVAFLTRLR